ncbi:MAG TPA: 6-hydroxymethylpterin diphosphokinase MptE-like protein [Acidobacteriota bacterium]|nr:6-hydroxymethylpterin diphosphokinase MptE-like protein [Acidobacteriota bacterium]
MRFVFDTDTGIRMAIMRTVHVCEVCGIEMDVVSRTQQGPMSTETYQCAAHPTARFRDAAHMIPDPCMVDPSRDYGWAGSRSTGDKKPTIQRANYNGNKALITDETVDQIPQCDVVYLVGAGPSLKKNAAALKEVTSGIVIALNAAINYAQADYFLAIDYAFTNVPAERAKKCDAILATSVNPALAALPWKRRLWMTSGVKAEPQTDIAEAHPKLWRFFEGLNCTFAAMQLIAQQIKPKRIVLVGMDCCFTDGEHHPGEPIAYGGGLHVVSTRDNRPALSCEILDWQGKYLAAQCEMLAEHNIEVINATEGGALPKVLTITLAADAKLADMVADNNKRLTQAI